MYDDAAGGRRDLVGLRDGGAERIYHQRTNTPRARTRTR